MQPRTLARALALSFFAGCHALVVQRTPAPISSFVSRAQGAGVTLQAISNTTRSATLDAIDIRYATNITVNGQNFRVVVDTGSVDLWLVTPPGFEFQDTGIPVSNGYGGGVVNGTLGFATVELGPYSVAQQAFNNAKSVTLGAILDLGLDGLIGMSTSGIGDASSIVQSIRLANMNTTLGAPFILNVFAQTPSPNNFVGISLARTDDQEGTADASFTINEVDPSYTAVQNTVKVPLAPANIGQWDFHVENFTLDGTPIELPLSSVPGAPSGQLVFRLDTGTPTAIVPQSLLDGIYRLIPGSQFAVVPFLGPQSMWTVPCNMTSILEMTIGGQQFPIHPLDLSDVFMDPETNVPVCASLISGQTTPTIQGFDILAGDTFMRNFYSVLNFGLTSPQNASESTGAFVQLLPQTNAEKAAQDAGSVRAALLASLSSSSSSSTSGSPTGSASADAAGATGSDSGSHHGKNGAGSGRRAGAWGVGMLVLMAMHVFLGL
ncbi:aspartic peptidase domain-containing protein [Roridomyces roridus]|uniref:Aspartic peptidase domain-containing protein n=1 Tax=Roridomyces roridus TaxID=1738132 RepID=A0AAD7F938_9AGAR|nr:aspartic peptidase domain-containing protein [Roridomyces roridus]